MVFFQQAKLIYIVYLKNQNPRIWNEWKYFDEGSFIPNDSTDA